MADAGGAMHQDFARWYGAVSLGDDPARREARWKGVLSLVRDAERPTVEALLRLAFGGRTTPAASDVNRIRHAFKTVDDTFEMSGNDREVQVLAGACLAVLMEDADECEGSAAALAVTTASLAGARKPDLPMDLAALGELAIGRRSDAYRKRPLLKEYASVEQPKVHFEQAVAKLRQQQDWNGLIDAFTLAASEIRTVLGTLAEQQFETIRAADEFIRTQDEELQMLWWLIAQRSEDYDCALDSVPAEDQPFVFANELANSTKGLPGPASAKAILSRAGLKERKKMRVTAAVNAPRTEWLRKLMDGVNPSPVSTPLHFAIQRQLETGAGEAWVAGWAATSGVDAGCTLPSLTLGELFYRERLLFLFA